FPGLGSVLESFGLRLGTALTLELLSSGAVKPEDDPWPVVDALMRGRTQAPQRAYEGELRALRKTWEGLSEERRALLELLSRFALTPAQAQRWYDTKERDAATSTRVTDAEILENPYHIAEVDLGEWGESPVSIGMIDRGLLPDSTVAARHPVPAPSRIDSQ